MLCKKCGYDNVEGANFCKNCGAAMENPASSGSFIPESVENKTQGEANADPVNKPVYPAPVGQNYSTASLVLGIVSIVLCCLSVVSCITGVLAIVYANKAKEQNGGDGASQAGMICGIIGIALGVITVLFYLLTIPFGSVLYHG